MKSEVSEGCKWRTLITEYLDDEIAVLVKEVLPNFSWVNGNNDFGNAEIVDRLWEGGKIFYL